MSLCIKCLNSTDGLCYEHTRPVKTDYVSFTATTTPKTYTKHEVLMEILHWATALCSAKWYEWDKKSHYKTELKEWVELYKEFK